MAYGKQPSIIEKINIECEEMMLYQYVPIKLIDRTPIDYEQRLHCFTELISKCCLDFIDTFGRLKYDNSYMYLTVKRHFITKDNNLNRFGYHSDGFMTDDINYVWSDNTPTVFNNSEFRLAQDDRISLLQMEQQADPSKDTVYPNKTLIRLDQFNIHKVAEVNKEQFRTFVKVSFSRDKYDLKGNSKNYMLDYDWDMRERKEERNIPQLLKNK